MAEKGKNPLSPVEAAVLAAIVEMGLKKGGPVGSEALAKRKRIGLCSASIRNIMAKLTREGYLLQPHSSAGREPSDQGYGYYALRLAPATRLSRAAAGSIIAAAEDPTLPETSARLDALSRIISRLSRQVSLAGIVSSEAAPIREYAFMRLGPGRVGVAMATMSGELLSNCLKVDWEPTAKRLERITAYFNSKMTYMTAAQARRLCAREMASASGEEAALAKDAHSLAVALEVWISALKTDTVIVEGAENLVNLVEDGEDIESVKALGDKLGEKNAMAQLLSSLAKGGVESVMIGSQTLIGELYACSVVAHPFAGRHGVAGAIGVIGKKRMDYGYTRALVALAARSMAKSLGDAQER